MTLRKLGLAAVGAACLWCGGLAPATAQYTPSPAWKIEQYDNGVKIYYCNGTVVWYGAGAPGTLEKTTIDRSNCPA